MQGASAPDVIKAQKGQEAGARHMPRPSADAAALEQRLGDGTGGAARVLANRSVLERFVDQSCDILEPATSLSRMQFRSTV